MPRSARFSPRSRLTLGRRWATTEAVQSFLTAFKYLTIFGRWSAPTTSSGGLSQAVLWFPLVGLTIGGILAAINYLLALQVDSEILSVLIVGLLIIATDGVPLAGTKKTFDALHEGHNAKPAANEAIFGLVAVVMLTLLKVHAINTMDDKVTANIFIAPALARWALVVLLHGYHERCEEMTRQLAANTKPWHLALTTMAVLALAFYLFGRKALWIALALSLFALLSRSLLHRRHAVLSQANLGAVTDGGEALTMVLLATL